MESNSSVDFTTYSNEGLLKAYRQINAIKFPENHRCCSAEIQRRKELGLWDLALELEGKDRPLDEDLRKRIANIIGLVLFVGGTLGFLGSLIVGYQYFPKFQTISGFASLGFGLLGFATSIFAGYKLCRDKEDWHGLASFLFLLQTVTFSFGGFAYFFIVGAYAPLGWNGQGLSLGVNFVSRFLFSTEGLNEPFTLNFNLIAFIALTYLGKIKRRELMP